MKLQHRFKIPHGIILIQLILEEENILLNNAFKGLTLNLIFSEIFKCIFLRNFSPEISETSNISLIKRYLKILNMFWIVFPFISWYTFFSKLKFTIKSFVLFSTLVTDYILWVKFIKKILWLYLNISFTNKRYIYNVKLCFNTQFLRTNARWTLKEVLQSLVYKLISKIFLIIVYLCIVIH